MLPEGGAGSGRAVASVAPSQDTAELSGKAHSICAFGFLKNALKARRGRAAGEAADWAGSSSNNG